MTGSNIEIRTYNRATDSTVAAVRPSEGKELHDWVDEQAEPDEPITVWVMDSGIHEDAVSDHWWFSDSEVVERYDVTDSENGGDNVGHGTGVASIISRLLPTVEFKSLRIFGGSGRTNDQQIEEAYSILHENAVSGDLVNMSWGSRSNDDRINELHDQLVSQGVHDVVAAGNTGDRGGSPATSTKAFSVGAVNREGRLPDFTSANPGRDNPDTAGLGVNVKMARAPETSMGEPIDSEFTQASGTSFSAPWQVAAYGAAYYRLQKNWDRDFETSAANIPGTPVDGEGVFKLQNTIQNKESDDLPVSTDVTVWNLLGDDAVYIPEDWLTGNEEKATLVDEDKESVTIRFE